MKNLLNKKTFLIFGASLFLFGCSNNEKSDDVNQKVSLEQKQQNIQTRNAEALDEAEAISFTDTDFLKTKQPMSSRVIDPIDDETGLVGDNAYNRKVYMYAVERLKKNAYIKDNQVYVSVKTGAEINMAEDLFDYLTNVLVKEWNIALKEGRYKVITEEKGGFYMMPVQQQKKKIYVHFLTIY